VLRHYSYSRTVSKLAADEAAAVALTAPYALANRVQHPVNVYLRENLVIGEVDQWLRSAPHERDAPPSPRLTNPTRRTRTLMATRRLT
jgi:hypothetical protein